MDHCNGRWIDSTQQIKVLGLVDLPEYLNHMVVNGYLRPMKILKKYVSLQSKICC